MNTRPTKNFPRNGDHTAFRRILDEKYLTGKELAERLDISPAHVSRIYNGTPLTASVDLACRFILDEFEEPATPTRILVTVPDAHHEVVTQFLTALNVPFTPI